MNHYDVIIIGTGAGGGTLAYALAPTGKRILLLDRGSRIPNEASNWNSKEIYIDGKYQTLESWTKIPRETVKPALYHRVGGNTKVYGGALFRMRPEDFGTVLHPDGISPEWCLNYSDLEPYYTQAERLYRVHGQRGIDPTEPPTTADYPAPALPHSDRIAEVEQQLREQGLQPFPLPMAIDYQPEATKTCILCGTCDGYPCKINQKADAQICCVEPALRYENVMLLEGAKVERLRTNAAGTQVTGVEVSREAAGEMVRELFSGDIVVVSCGAVNSAALLLQSASDVHPNGLGNRSGLVGRNFMRHNLSKLYAIGMAENPTVFQKTLGINDFYRGTAEIPYPLGHVHLMGKHNWEMMRPDLPKVLPQGVLEWIAKHSIDWWAQSEDLPDGDNRVWVDRQGKIQVRYQPNNLKAHRQLKRKFKAILREIGFPLILDVTVPFKILNHQVGTCRFGDDPASSVLNRDCRSHEVDNLYVVDASFFPSSAAVNPSLTIIANALRVAEHLKRRLGAAGKVGEVLSGM
ncbi:MAG: dehydrogenase [Alkalinema sp. CACIAM 70d]|nr:MAG: dehydrogenase [Alkalinema sp. CACIAM 70d]